MTLLLLYSVVMALNSISFGQPENPNLILFNKCIEYLFLVQLALDYYQHQVFKTEECVMSLTLVPLLLEVLFGFKNPAFDNVKILRLVK